MFDTLLELPLFQGLGKNDITHIVETVKLNFAKVPQGECIVSQDELCRGLIFLLEGTLIRHTESDDRSYAVSERITAPAVLQPEVLYGWQTRYTHSYIAHTGSNIVSIEKQVVNRVLMQYEVFRINLLNLLSTQVVRNQRLFWHNSSGSTEQRIVKFIRNHSSYPAGEKILNIKMEDLALQLNDTRINVSRALNSMQKKGILLLKRKEIIIPALEKLLTGY